MKRILSEAFKRFLRLAADELPEGYEDWLRRELGDLGAEEEIPQEASSSWCYDCSHSRVIGCCWVLRA